MKIWRKRWFETLAPALIAASALCLLVYFQDALLNQFEHTGSLTGAPWQPANLYNAVFNWASIQSGFVFGIYGFIATKRDGFIGQIPARDYNTLLGYARRAYITGFALTFVSLPIMVASPSLDNPGNVAFLVIAIWFSWFIWTFCAFLRVALIFGMIVATPDKEPRIVG